MLSDSTISLIFISKQRRSIILEIVLVRQPDHHLEVKLNLTELSVVDVVNYLLHGLLIHLFHVNLVDVGHNGCSENRRVGTEKVLVDVEDLLVVLLPIGDLQVSGGNILHDLHDLGWADS